MSREIGMKRDSQYVPPHRRQISSPAAADDFIDIAGGGDTMTLKIVHSEIEEDQKAQQIRRVRLPKDAERSVLYKILATIYGLNDQQLAGTSLINLPKPKGCRHMLRHCFFCSCLPSSSTFGWWL